MMRFMYFEKSRTSAALHAWPAEAGAAAARKNRHRVFARQRKSGDHIALVARNHHAHRHLAIVRRVGGIGRASANVEAHLAFDGGAQVRFERCKRSHRQ